MKKVKILLFLFLTSTLSLLNAANVDIYTHNLNWEIKTVYSQLSSKQILSFDNVHYDENNLPHFLYVFNSAGEEYHFSFVNTQFAPLSEEKKALILNTGADIPEEIEFNTFRRVEAAGIREFVHFLPVIYSEGEYKKLISFDLVVARVENEARRAAPLSLSRHTFPETSVMNTGNWVKMRVSQSGIYRISHQQIIAAGLDPNDIRVFGYGGALIDEDFRNPRINDLPQQAIFRGTDYILFYAQGPISWRFNRIAGEFVHTVNPYSFYGYYFLASGVTTEAPRTIQMANEVNLGNRTPTEVTTFRDYALHEVDLVNLIAGSSGIGGSGREFYGEEFTNLSTTRNFTLTVPNIVVGSTANLRFDAAVFTLFSGARSSFDLTVEDANSRFYYNNVPPGNHYVRGTSQVNPLVSFTANSPTTSINLRFNPIIPASRGWLNFLRLTAQRHLVMHGNYMTFSNAGSESTALARYVLSNANQNIQIWEITDQINIVQIPATYSNGTLSFLVENSGNRFRKFVAVDVTNDFSVPSSRFQILGSVPNQNLHGLPNVDYVIISHPDFLEQAERLADAHRTYSNLSVLVVPQQAIFNEFSSGTPDASAIRWFMKMFYDRWHRGQATTETRYLLLFGDGSFDNRGIHSNTEGHNKIITFQSAGSLSETLSFVIDDYFGFLDDDEGISFSFDRLDIGIGRFPVRTVAEARAVVDQTISYIRNENVGAWKNQLIFLADDGDGSAHGTQADTLAEGVLSSHPEFNVVKLYMDAFEQVRTAAGESYPQLRRQLLDLLRRGTLVFNYIGHGSVRALSSENVITHNDIINMRNTNLPLWITATCDFARFDSGTSTAGETVLLNPNGGGVALFTTNRVVFSTANQRLMLGIYNHIFSRDENGNRLRLGSIMRRAKAGVSDNNRLSWALLGDPALMLAQPEYRVHTRTVNGQNVEDANITIGAMSQVTITGYIADNNATKLSNFNGVITMLVFDKEREITTLNNDNCTANGSFTFTDRPTLFLGKAEVINGEFTTTFMVPRNINYAFGFGRIVYYAVDVENNMEAHGHFSNIIIGGTDNRPINDNQGPDIHMYLNTPHFRNRDVVNNSPLFVAHLFDEHGINRVGTGIGQDIVLLLNDREWIVLNDAFEPVLGTYRRGTVRHKFEDLPEGRHTLFFRAWDLLNNSSSNSLEFTVGENISIGILDTYAFPNPATTSTSFVLVHNRPDEVLDVVLRVFDISGRELWSYSAEFFSMDNRIVIKEWDLTSNSGQRLQRGIYLFQVEVVLENGRESTKARKFIVN